MKVHAVHVDRIYVEDGKGMTESVRYEFHEPTWVSAHRGRDGTRIGPLTVLDEFEDEAKLEDTSVVQFEPYSLPTEDDDGEPVISYRDTWTIPRGTLYSIVLPPEFVAEHVAVKHSDPGDDFYYSLEAEATPEEAIFYRAVVSLDGPTNVQVRARRAPDEWEDRLDEIGVVDPPVETRAPVDLVKQKSPSPGFYLLLLKLRDLFS